LKYGCPLTISSDKQGAVLHFISMELRTAPYFISRQESLISGLRYDCPNGIIRIIMQPGILHGSSVIYSPGHFRVMIKKIPFPMIFNDGMLCCPLPFLFTSVQHKSFLLELLPGLSYTKHIKQTERMVPMSTLEQTVSMLENMPEEARVMVFNYTQNLFTSRKPANPFRKMTTEDVLTDLELSRSQIDADQGMNMKEALKKMGERHGFL